MVEAADIENLGYVLGEYKDACYCIMDKMPIAGACRHIECENKTISDHKGIGLGPLTNLIRMIECHT